MLLLKLRDHGMPKQETAAQLKQFNQKVDRLLNLDFINLLLTTKPGLTVAVKDERSGASSKFIDDFVRIFNFFIPDDGKALFEELSKLYSTLKGFERGKDDFESARAQLDTFLDSPSNMEVGGSLSKRELLEIFVYGALAGKNEEKKDTYDKWISQNVTEAIITNRFIGILVKVFEGIANIRRINEAVIVKLTS